VEATLEQELDLAVDQVYLVGAVYDRLIEALMRGLIKPGERLYIQPLAEQLNVSPTPLRQALMKMVGEGLVTTSPRRGMYVIKPTPAEVRDLFEVRLICELHSIERALPRLTAENLRRLEHLVDECDVCLTSEVHSEWAYGQADQELHRYLVGLAGNAVLSKVHGNLKVQTLVIVQSPEITRRRARETSSEHHRILAALQDRDLEEAKEAVRQHLDRALDAALEHLAAGSPETLVERV
jgi:DNA-binding GntR family transcriptional regulator